MSDITIIGGGPAGSSAAIRLAQNGFRVRLFEKKRFPRSKLCGGFLSPESLDDLEQLGVLEGLKKVGAYPVRRTVIASRTGTRIECGLASEGLSVSRSSLDDLLLQQARQAGAEIRFEASGFEPSDGVCTVVAAGRMHQSKYTSGKKYFGVQAFFDHVQGISDQVELDLVDSGYVGLVRQNEGINVCALTTQEAIHAAGGSLNRLLIQFLNENATLRGHLQEANRISEWMSTGPVYLGVRQLTAMNTFFTGDAACVMDPFAGEGMAMGLYASRLLVHALNQQQLLAAQVYEALWHQAFDPALRWNTAMRALYSVPLLREPVMQALSWFPKGMSWLTDLTRYRAIEGMN